MKTRKQFIPVLVVLVLVILILVAAYLKAPINNPPIAEASSKESCRADRILPPRTLVRGDKTSNGKSIADYTNATEANPDDPNTYRSRADAHFHRGFVYQRKGDYDKAIAEYTKAIEIMPKDTLLTGYLIRGRTYDIHAYEHGEKNDYDKAIADYTKAIDLDPDSAPYYRYRGSVYFRRASAFSAEDDYDKAIADYTKAIKLDPKAEAYFCRGVAYAQKGEHDLAIADLNQAIKLDPKYADAYYGRGLAYCAEGDYDKARNDIRKAESLGKKVDPKVLKAISYFTLGSHKDEVVRAQGTPDSINRYTALGFEQWRYGLSTVKLSTQDGRVTEWDNYGNLKVRLGSGKDFTPTKPPENGRISCIVGIGDNHSAMIGTKLVPEGGIIDGVTVVKIYEDRVVFDKGGKRWTQKVGDAPDPAWR